MSTNLALSLAMSADYPNAIAVLQPLALAPTASPRERQTLALIYGLNGNVSEAARLNRIDLDDASVEHNLAYYKTLRELSPEAPSQAILSTRSGQTAPTPAQRPPSALQRRITNRAPSTPINSVGRRTAIIGADAGRPSLMPFGDENVQRARRWSASFAE